MNTQQSLLTARGLTDNLDRLLTADEPLAELHENCGGRLPGTLAVPEILELVREGRRMNLRISRSFQAFDGDGMVSGFARIKPLTQGEGGGCEILIDNWHTVPANPFSGPVVAGHLDSVDRAVAEITARLDARQCVRYLNANARDAIELEKAIANEPGKIWSEYVELVGLAHRQPLHWRILDGTQCRLPGSDRTWRARLIPVGNEGDTPKGFELLMIADEPLEPARESFGNMGDSTGHTSLIGTALTPVLRQPIARIIANAETIRTRLAGPLRPEYCDYAGNIAAAGQHLIGMLDDLADLEVVEAADFQTAKDRVDLADAAHRAAGILGVRAQNRAITINLTACDSPVMAVGDFRRVLQVLINLIGNAIAYSPEGSDVSVAVAQAGEGLVEARVLDQGPGIEPDQAERIFDKFERLGRDSDGGNDTGSGLGLYISRKLAVAMDGDLSVRTNREDLQGAEFRLILPKAG